MNCGNNPSLPAVCCSPDVRRPRYRALPASTVSNCSRYCTSAITRGGPLALAVILLATTPVAAQSTGEAFCDTPIVKTIQNQFTLIQFGGPLIGGTVALGSTVGLSIVDRPERLQNLKEMRNRALIYGVLIAPIAGAILASLLNNVVAGGASCGF